MKHELNIISKYLVKEGFCHFHNNWETPYGNQSAGFVETDYDHQDGLVATVSFSD